MNYFDQKAKIKYATFYLVIIYFFAICAAIALSAIILSFLATLHHGVRHGYDQDGLFYVFLWSCIITAAITIPTLIILSLQRMYKFSRYGGVLIANEVRAVEISANKNDYNIQRLNNIIEEISISASVKKPKIYLLKDQLCIDAFSAGNNTNDAIIVITQGAINELDRDEMLALIATQFGHITSGNMRLNNNMVSILYGLIVMQVIGNDWMKTANDNDQKSKDIGQSLRSIVGYMLALTGYIGIIFSHWVKIRINSERDQLADINAIRYARDNSGLTRALKKIAAGAFKDSDNLSTCETLSHMLFSRDAIARLKLIEPNFNPGELAEIKRKMLRKAKAREDLAALTTKKDADTQNQIDLMFISTSSVYAERVIAVQAMPTDDEKPIEKINQTQPIVTIEQMHDDMQFLQETALNKHGAIPLLLALLYGSDALTIEKQDAIILKLYNKREIEISKQLKVNLKKINKKLYLALAILCLGILDKKKAEELTLLLDVATLAVNTKNLDIYHYSIQQVLNTHINDLKQPDNQTKAGVLQLEQVTAEAIKLISIFAEIGSSNLDSIQKAYASGLKMTFPDAAVTYVTIQSQTQVLDELWPILNALDAPNKQRLIEGLITTTAYDNEISTDEMHLLRATCYCLHYEWSQLDKVLMYKRKPLNIIE